MVSPSTFGSYPGPWYVVGANGQALYSTAAIIATDPTMDVRIIDTQYSATSSGSDVTGGSIIQGDNLTFRVDTNTASAFNGNRNETGWSAATGYGAQNVPVKGYPQDGFIDIKVKTAAGNTLTQLWNNNALNGGVAENITYQNVTVQPWYWNSLMPGNTANAMNGIGGTTYTTAIGNWSTGATDTTGQQAYPAGTYTVTAYSYLNAMFDNYLTGGSYYTDKTVSEARTVTILANTVTLTANQDTVVRSKPFSVTITGRPNTYYYLFLKSTSSMAGTYDNQPPMLQQSQAGVTFDPALNASYGINTAASTSTTGVGLNPNWAINGAAVNYTSPTSQSIGAYEWQNGGGSTTDQAAQTASSTTGTIYSAVAGSTVSSTATTALTSASDTPRTRLLNGTLEYAMVQLDQTGSRTVGFVTTNWTKAQQYTIRVENLFGTQYKNDEVTVTVQKGAVTIVAAGDQSYYLGEQVDFSGTNTESSDTWLFITGPNLPQYGGDLLNPHNCLPGDTPMTGYGTGSQADASVAGDNTWSYKWGTSNIDLDAGTYTIYAVSQKTDSQAANLADVAYGTVSIVIKKPFVSATASQSVVAQGDQFDITGTAQGNPTLGVQIWILGKNYELVTSQSVNSDSSFDYTVQRATTTNLYTGQYYVVVQHPMMNGQFDITPYTLQTGDPGTKGNIVVINKQSPTSGGPGGYQQVFQLTGSGSLQGSDAAEALIEGLNSPNVDDTYTKLQFLVEVPTITVDPIGDRHVGDKFTITGTTNLAVGDQILIQIYSSSFTPTQKTQSGAFSGATGTVTVTQGSSSSGLNTWSFDVDASTFKADEYLVTATSVLTTGTGTALFNVLEGTAATAAPTAAPAVTTAAPTMVVPTTVPTTVATPVPTQTTTPGFGAFVALIGLGAVAFVIVRRH
jgi:PGF-CTERM protein